MRKILKAFLLAVILYFPASAFAQEDSVWLQCPLNDATVVPPPKNVIHYDQPDLCIVLVSMPDTIVKACYNGKVTNIEQTDDGKWDVVFYFRDYYFWYSGLSKPLVRRNDVLKTGQAVGTIAPGDKIEMLLYKFETQLDPTRYLGCTKILGK